MIGKKTRQLARLEVEWQLDRLFTVDSIIGGGAGMGSGSSVTLQRGARVRGLIPGEAVTLRAVDPVCDGVPEVLYRTDAGETREAVLSVADLDLLEIDDATMTRPRQAVVR